MWISRVCFALAAVYFLFFLLCSFWGDAFAALILRGGAHRTHFLVLWEVSERMVTVFAVLSLIFGSFAGLFAIIEAVVRPRRTGYLG